MMHATQWTVPAERAGAKLDRLVAEVAQVSRRAARLLIAMGRVRVNRRSVRILARPIPAGANLEILPDRLPWQADTASIRQAPVAPTILFSDRWVVALAKPAGLLSETDRFGSPSMQTVVPKMLAALGQPSRVWLVHRLDAGTSGVLLMARTPQAAAALSASFRDRATRKIYLALCQGPLQAAIDVDAPIARAQGTRHQVSPQGRAAQTAFTPLEFNALASLVRCKPHGGRTHQIRVHLAHLGYPILGDRLYGGPGYGPAAAQHVPLLRPLLHAQILEVAHPTQAGCLRLQAAVPADLRCAAQAFGLGGVL